MAGQFMDIPTQAVKNTASLADADGAFAQINTFIHQHSTQLVHHRPGQYPLHANTHDSKDDFSQMTKSFAQGGFDTGACVATILTGPLDVVGGTGVHEEGSTGLMEHGGLVYAGLIAGEAMAALGAGLGATVGAIAGLLGTPVAAIYAAATHKPIQAKAFLVKAAQLGSDIGGVGLGVPTTAVFTIAAVVVRAASAGIKLAMASCMESMGFVAGTIGAAGRAIVNAIRRHKTENVERGYQSDDL